MAVQYNRVFVQAVREWVQAERDRGHAIFTADLARQYILSLKSEIGTIERYLADLKERETVFDSSQRARDKLGRFLIGQTGLQTKIVQFVRDSPVVFNYDQAPVWLTPSSGQNTKKNKPTDRPINRQKRNRQPDRRLST